MGTVPIEQKSGLKEVSYENGLKIMRTFTLTRNEMEIQLESENEEEEEAPRKRLMV